MSNRRSVTVKQSGAIFIKTESPDSCYNVNKKILSGRQLRRFKAKVERSKNKNLTPVMIMPEL